jgi:hypothetical protein
VQDWSLSEFALSFAIYSSYTDTLKREGRGTHPHGQVIGLLGKWRREAKQLQTMNDYQEKKTECLLLQNGRSIDIPAEARN